jgi:hypothetical protein
MDAERNVEHSEADPPVRGKSTPSAATIAQFSRKGIPRPRFFRSAFGNTLRSRNERPRAADAPAPLPIVESIALPGIPGASRFLPDALRPGGAWLGSRWS